MRRVLRLAHQHDDQQAPHLVQVQRPGQHLGPPGLGRVLVLVQPLAVDPHPVPPEAAGPVAVPALTAATAVPDLAARGAGRAAHPVQLVQLVDRTGQANPPAHPVPALAALVSAAMTSVSLDFAVRQERYQTARHFMRDVLLRGIAFHSLVKVNVSGLEYIPPSGPTIVMMNHTGGIDPFLMLGVVRPRFVVPMSKVENFKLPVIGLMMKWWGAYPIRRGEVDRAALQNTVDLLKAGNLVLMAPEGTRQPAMIEGKAGLTYVATRADAMIVPVGIEGSRDFMRNLKRLRRSPISLTFGPAFRFKVNVDAGERVPRARLAQMTQEAMYQLARLVTPARRGFYSDLDKATTEWIEFVT